MAKFKEGDLVRIKENCSGTLKDINYRLRFGGSANDKNVLYAWDESIGDIACCGCSCQRNWEKVENLGKYRK